MNAKALPTVGLVAACLAGGLATSATAATTPKPASAHTCFWTRDVNNFQAQDDRTVNIRVGAKDVYQLTLFSPAPDIDWAQHIGIESRGSSSICSGLDATIIVPSSIGPQHYPVTTVRKLSPQDVAALPSKARP